MGKNKRWRDNTDILFDWVNEMDNFNFVTASLCYSFTKCVTHPYTSPARNGNSGKLSLSIRFRWLEEYDRKQSRIRVQHENTKRKCAYLLLLIYISLLCLPGNPLSKNSSSFYIGNRFITLCNFSGNLAFFPVLPALIQYLLSFNLLLK